MFSIWGQMTCVGRLSVSECPSNLILGTSTQPSVLICLCVYICICGVLRLSEEQLKVKNVQPDVLFGNNQDLFI